MRCWGCRGEPAAPPWSSEVALPRCPGRENRFDPEVAALAISLTQAGTPGLTPAEQAVALSSESITLAGQVDLLAHMTWLTRDVDAAVTQLEESGLEEFRESGTELARSITEICTEAARHVTSPTEASRLLAFADSLSNATSPDGARNRGDETPRAPNPPTSRPTR